ncbi:hypothetical protein Hte_002365 [Hypoxylon texense]
MSLVRLLSRLEELKAFIRQKIHPKPPAKNSDDEASDLSYACAWVASAVTLAMTDIINAQARAAGVPVSAEMAKFIADHISSFLRSYMSSIITKAEDVFSHYLLIGRVNFQGLRFHTDALFRKGYLNSRSSARDVAYRIRDTFDIPVGPATVAAIAKAEVDARRAVADVVRAYVSTAEPTVESVRFLQKLMGAAIAAASQAAERAADIQLLDHSPPPYSA